MQKPPSSLEEMRSMLLNEHEQLSRRLKEISHYISTHPQSVALDTAAIVAEKSGVPASTLVRFATHFGFSGFSELQKLYKEHLHDNYYDYGARIRLSQGTGGDTNEVTPLQLLNEFTEANQLALQSLRNQIQAEQLNTAIDMLDAAPAIHVCGIRRAFPVSMYITYTLNHIGVKCHAISGLGMMHEQQLNCIAEQDALIAITFPPFAEVTQNAVKVAKKKGAKILLITGDLPSPSADYADIILSVQEAQVRSFRSLSSSLCLAQTLCISLGYRRERQTQNNSEY